VNGTGQPNCADVPLRIYSLIHAVMCQLWSADMVRGSICYRT